MGINDTAIRELIIIREGVLGTVPEWRAGYEAEMKAVEGKRLIKLVGVSSFPIYFGIIIIYIKARAECSGS